MSCYCRHMRTCEQFELTPAEASPLNERHCAPDCDLLADCLGRCRDFEDAPHLVYDAGLNLYERCQECKTKYTTVKNRGPGFR